MKNLFLCNQNYITVSHADSKLCKKEKKKTVKMRVLHYL